MRKITPALRDAAPERLLLRFFRLDEGGEELAVKRFYVLGRKRGELLVAVDTVFSFLQAGKRCGIAAAQLDAERLRRQRGCFF